MVPSGRCRRSGPARRVAARRHVARRRAEEHEVETPARASASRSLREAPDRARGRLRAPCTRSASRATRAPATRTGARPSTRSRHRRRFVATNVIPGKRCANQASMQARRRVAGNRCRCARKKARAHRAARASHRDALGVVEVDQEQHAELSPSTDRAVRRDSCHRSSAALPTFSTEKLAVGLHHRQLDARDVVDALLAQLAHELVHRHPLLAQVARAGCCRRGPARPAAARGARLHRPPAERRPVEQQVARRERAEQHRRVGERAVLAGHAVLRRVGDEHDEQHVRARRAVRGRDAARSATAGRARRRSGRRG